MIYKKFLTLGSILLIFMNSIYGQELLKLDEAISIALEKNHQIKVARNTAQISKNSAHPGNAGFLPKVDLSSAINYADEPVRTASANRNTRATVSLAQVEASCNILNGFGGYYSFKKLKSMSESGELLARNKIELTLVSVITAYYNVAAAAEALSIRQEAFAISAERLQRAQKRAGYGQANKIDVLNAQVDMNADSVLVLNSRLQLAEAQRNLNFLLNRKTETPFSVEKTVTFLPRFSVKDVREQAYMNNASYLLAQLNLKQSEYDIYLARSGHLPRLDLRTEYNYSQIAPDLAVEFDDPGKSFSAGLSLSFNLFDGFQRSINTQNARISQNTQKLLLQEARLKLAKEVSIAFKNYENKRSVLNLEQNNLHSAQLNFQRTQELYNLGRLTGTELRQAQLNLIRVKYNISQAKFQLKLSETELLRLSGRLVNEEL